jgi:hypothetical protein
VTAATLGLRRTGSEHGNCDRTSPKAQKQSDFHLISSLEIQDPPPV